VGVRGVGGGGVGTSHSLEVSAPRPWPPPLYLIVKKPCIVVIAPPPRPGPLENFRHPCVVMS
jgi:hypothetical protein